MASRPPPAKVSLTQFLANYQKRKVEPNLGFRLEPSANIDKHSFPHERTSPSHQTPQMTPMLRNKRPHSNSIRQLLRLKNQLPLALNYPDNVAVSLTSSQVLAKELNRLTNCTYIQGQFRNEFKLQETMVQKYNSLRSRVQFLSHLNCQRQRYIVTGMFDLKKQSVSLWEEVQAQNQVNTSAMVQLQDIVFQNAILLVELDGLKSSLLEKEQRQHEKCEAVFGRYRQDLEDMKAYVTQSKQLSKIEVLKAQMTKLNAQLQSIQQSSSLNVQLEGESSQYLEDTLNLLNTNVKQFSNYLRDTDPDSYRELQLKKAHMERIDQMVDDYDSYVFSVASTVKRLDQYQLRNLNQRQTTSQNICRQNIDLVAEITARQCEIEAANKNLSEWTLQSQGTINEKMRYVMIQNSRISSDLLNKTRLITTLEDSIDQCNQYLKSTGRPIVQDLST